MKHCMNCGAELSDKAVVCVKCGYIQQNTGKETASVKKPAPAASGSMLSVAAAPATAAPVPKQAVSTAPVGQLKTNRGLLKFILLSMITFGIYGIVVMSAVSTDINIIAGRYDGRKTMHYCWVYFLFSWLTLGIVPIVWSHKISARIGGELSRRGIDYRFGAGSFWGWNVLGSFILVGPFIYTHKLLKSMNLLAENYNIYG